MKVSGGLEANAKTKSAMWSNSRLAAGGTEGERWRHPTPPLIGSDIPVLPWGGHRIQGYRKRW